MEAEKLYPSVFVSFLATVIILLFPLLKTPIPASLVGILIPSIVAAVFQLGIPTLSDYAGKAAFSGGLSSLPKFAGIPDVPFNFDTLSKIFHVSLGIVGIAWLETLLASKISNKLYPRRPSKEFGGDGPVVDGDRATVGLGLGTIATSLFGGFGGCGLIPNTLLNGKAGGTGAASTLTFAVSLALFTVVLAPIIGQIPLAALAGLMFTVAYNTFEWHESYEVLLHGFKGLQGFLDVIGLFATFALCFTDMGLGVVAGVVITKGIPFALKYITGRAASEEDHYKSH